MQHDLKSLTRQWFDEVWSKRNEAVISQMAMPDVIVHGLSEDGKPTHGTDSSAILAQLRLRFPRHASQCRRYSRGRRQIRRSPDIQWHPQRRGHRNSADLSTIPFDANRDQSLVR